jgi:hypothetical protein
MDLTLLAIALALLALTGGFAVLCKHLGDRKR